MTFDVTDGEIATVRGIAAPARHARLAEAWRRYGPDAPLITRWRRDADRRQAQYPPVPAAGALGRLQPSPSRKASPCSSSNHRPLLQP